MQIPQTVLRRYCVKENRLLADGCFALILEALDVENELTPFLAGQWVYVHLLNPDGTSWARAAYSIASSPSQGTSVIELGIKVEGNFTSRAAQLAVGDNVLMQGPWGVFTLKNVQRIAFMAGGIGVTPLLSMVREALSTDRKVEMIFFYSFRTPEGAAYLEEMRTLASADARLTLIPVCTGASTDWQGARGRISDELLARHLPQGADDYMLCGPDAFMEDLRTLLIARGADAKKIRRESFG